MGLKITAFQLVSLLVIFSVIISESEAGRRRKIIIHVPVKVKQQKHTHTLVKPLHVHHKQTVIKEEKVIKQEIHKPTHHTKEIIQQPIIHHEHHGEHHEVEHLPEKHIEIKEHKPIFQEEISHEHLHHHYKHVHPDTSNDLGHNYEDPQANSYHFASSHP